MPRPYVPLSFPFNSIDSSRFPGCGQRPFGKLRDDEYVFPGSAAPLSKLPPLISNIMHRPAICRGFSAAWLLQLSSCLALRPERTHVMTPSPFKALRCRSIWNWNVSLKRARRELKCRNGRKRRASFAAAVGAPACYCFEVSRKLSSGNGEVFPPPECGNEIAPTSQRYPPIG